MQQNWALTVIKGHQEASIQHMMLISHTDTFLWVSPATKWSYADKEWCLLLCMNVKASQTCPALSVCLTFQFHPSCLHLHSSRPEPLCRSALIWKNLTPSLHQCSYCSHCILSAASISNLCHVGKLQTSPPNKPSTKPKVTASGPSTKWSKSVVSLIGLLSSSNLQEIKQGQKK